MNLFNEFLKLWSQKLSCWIYFCTWWLQNVHSWKFIFLKIGIVEIFIMKSFISQFTIARILLMKISFFSTHCDCRNLKDNLLKLNYDCGNDHDIFKILQIAIIGILIMIFFPFAYCDWKKLIHDDFKKNYWNLIFFQIVIAKFS